MCTAGSVPIADDRDVGLDDPAAPRHDALQPPVALEPRDQVVEVHHDPVVAMDRLEHPPDVAAQDAVERRLEDLDHGDVAAHRPQRRGDLRPDEAHPHARHARPAVHRVAEPRRVADVPEVEHAGEVRARRLDPPVVSARRHDQRVERHPFAARQDDLARVRIELRDVGAEPRLDVLLREPLGRSHHDLLERVLAAQVLLRQRRPLVGRQLLRADQDDPAVEPLGAERRDGGGPAQARADDDERSRIRHPIRPRSGARRSPRERGTSRWARWPAPPAPHPTSCRTCCRGIRT